jgi:hypothetical protein
MTWPNGEWTVLTMTAKPIRKLGFRRGIVGVIASYAAGRQKPPGTSLQAFATAEKRRRPVSPPHRANPEGGGACRVQRGPFDWPAPSLWCYLLLAGPRSPPAGPDTNPARRLEAVVRVRAEAPPRRYRGWAPICRRGTVSLWRAVSHRKARLRGWGSSAATGSLRSTGRRFAIWWNFNARCGAGAKPGSPSRLTVTGKANSTRSASRQSIVTVI